MRISSSNLNPPISRQELLSSDGVRGRLRGSLKLARLSPISWDPSGRSQAFSLNESQEGSVSLQVLLLAETLRSERSPQKLTHSPNLMRVGKIFQ